MLPASAAHCYEPPPRTLKPQNSPHATRRMWPSGHQNSPTQNPEMCRCRWVEQKKSRIAHPKWRQRRSLSIAVAVAVAPSIATCTNRRACENNNPPAHRSRGAVGGEKRSTCAGWTNFGALRPLPTRCGRPSWTRVVHRVGSLPGLELPTSLCSGHTSGPAPPHAARP